MSEERAEGFLGGFLFGALVGLALGILYAPRPGEEVTQSPERQRVTEC